MSVFVEGSYDSYEDAIRAVDTLVMRGHEKDDIKLTGNATALKDYDDAAGISAVEHSKLTRQEETTVLEKYETDLQSGKLILLVNEDGDQDKEQSEDIPVSDGNSLEDLQNSETDLSGNRSSNDVGLSSDVNPSTEDTAGGSGLNRSI